MACALPLTAESSEIAEYKPELFGKFNLELLKAIECPTCLETMTANIYICELGHSICHKCRWEVRDCPVCRRNLTNRRNYMLESLTELLYYPCNHTGCAVHTRKKHIISHYIDCDYYPYQCILDEKCRWNGPRIHLKNHILDEHKVNAWMRNENLDKWKENSEDNLQAIIAYDNVFYIYMKHDKVHNDPSKSFVYWGVQYIGQSEKAKNFEFKMNIYTDEDNRDITFREICHSDKVSIEEIIETGRCVGLTVKKLKTFINEYKCVWFKLAIIELES